MQRNWIGRSEGVELTFPMASFGGITVYTTGRHLNGRDLSAVAPQHPVAKAAADGNPEIAEFVEACNQVKMAEADMAKLEKLGMDSGLVAEHPLTGEPIPVWIANFVLMEYGSGA